MTSKESAKAALWSAIELWGDAVIDVQYTTLGDGAGMPGEGAARATEKSCRAHVNRLLDEALGNES